MVDTIATFMDRVCFQDDVLVIRHWRNFEMAVGYLPGECLTCVRNRCRQRFGVGVPKAHPDEDQPVDYVALLTVVTAVNGLHVGY